MRKSFNTSHGIGRQESEEDHSPTCDVYKNVPSPSLHLGAASEITDISTDQPFEGGTGVEITDLSEITFTSQTPSSITFSRDSRSGFTRPNSRATRRSSSHLGFINPAGQFSRTLGDRGKFLWRLVKLNFRMLISLTLTLFVAVFVSPHFLLFRTSVVGLT